MDSITARALRQWAADHPFVTESGSWECPACNAADACTELTDRRWICRSPTHKDCAPAIGTFDGDGYVGHRFEFQLCCERRDIRARLESCGYLGERSKPLVLCDDEGNVVPLALVRAAEAAIDDALENAVAEDDDPQVVLEPSEFWTYELARAAESYWRAVHLPTLLERWNVYAAEERAGLDPELTDVRGRWAFDGYDYTDDDLAHAYEDQINARRDEFLAELCQAFVADARKRFIAELADRPSRCISADILPPRSALRPRPYMRIVR